MGTRCGQPDPGVLLYLMAEKKMGAEEIVSKRRGSRYRSGNCRRWLKSKNPAFVRT